MKLTVTIDFDDDAFNAASGNPPEVEAARVLREFAARAEREGLPNGYVARLYDFNGNRCGTATVG